MTRRTRSILVDSTLGRIFTNVVSSAASDASKLIAGTKTQRVSFTSPRTMIARVLSNAGASGLGLRFSNNALITSVVMNTAGEPTGRDLQIQLKKGSSYATSTAIGTFTLTAGSKVSTNAVAISITAGESIFMDIIQVGSVKPGTGLSVDLNFYAG